MNYALAGVAAIAVLLGVWLFIERADNTAKKAEIESRDTRIGDLRSKLKLAAVTIEANAQTLEAYRAQVTDMHETLSAFAMADRQRAEATLREMETIANAPASDDGLVAPVLRAQLDRMLFRTPGPDSAKGNSVSAGAAPAP